MDHRHHQITLYSPQSDAVIEAIKRDGVCFSKPEYIKACEEAGRWVEEAAFEWTAVDAKSKIDGASIAKWRRQGGRAFEKAK